MRGIFEAESVVVIGASDRPGNLGCNVLQNLLQWEYGGKIYAVNPRGGSVLGIPLHASVEELPETPDLAVAMVPARNLPEVMEECGKRGIARMAIPSGGFEELGEEGKELQERIKSIARHHRIRFVGPNCLAIINAHSGLCLPFVPVPSDLRRGGVSIIAQSGGIGLDILIRLYNENVGFAKFVSTGNKADLDEVDYLEYLGRDPDTAVICLYLEDVQRGREFLQAVRIIKKPVLVYKANVTPLSRQSAVSHTAALANDDRVMAAALRQAGAIRVESLRELAGLAKVFSLPPLRGDRIALVSPTGGLLVLASDRCHRHGLVFPPLRKELEVEIASRLRAGVVRVSNPVDLGDVHDPESRLYIVDRLLGEDYIDGVVLALISRMSTDPKAFSTGGLKDSQRNLVPDLAEVCRRRGKPIILALLANDIALFNARRSADLPIFADPEEAVDAAAVLRDWWRSSQRRGGS